MTTITKTELRWMLNMVEKSREESKILMDSCRNIDASLYRLNHDNMSSLAEKLETVIKSDKKRIAVRW